MKKQISEYVIGDELFRHVSGGGTFHYVVDGVRKYNDNVQLEVECQTCSHGWKCRLLIAQNDYGNIVHVHMLNEDEDDDQKHWHCNDGMHFWPTKDEARKEGLRACLRSVNDRIKVKQDSLDADIKYRDQLAAAIDDAV